MKEVPIFSAIWQQLDTIVIEIFIKLGLGAIKFQGETMNAARLLKSMVYTKNFILMICIFTLPKQKN